MDLMQMTGAALNEGDDPMTTLAAWAIQQANQMGDFEHSVSLPAGVRDEFIAATAALGRLANAARTA